MKFLVIGQGGREHAIVKALLTSPRTTEVHALPGSSGLSQEILCHPIDPKNHEAVIRLCLQLAIDVVMIGPEDPLVDGLADSLRLRGILVVGPEKELAQLEGSKIYSKEFMQRFSIPTARADLVSTVSETMEKSKLYSAPYVLKADGLAAGKGVFICETQDQLRQAAEALFEKKTLGAAGERALLEEYQPGWELSYLILTNGQDYKALPLAQDHKRLKDGQQGPNTGGMGTYAPLHIDTKLHEEIRTKILLPTIEGLRASQCIYRGVVFLGLMITKKGPQVLEYNVRFGDPETQVILPLLDGDWAEVFYNLARGELLDLKFKNLYSCCVVLAAEGYPDHPVKGALIEGDFVNTESSYFLHAGTQLAEDKTWRTAGGRVLNCVGLGSDRAEARQKAYELTKKIHWQGLQMRNDICIFEK